MGILLKGVGLKTGVFAAGHVVLVPIMRWRCSGALALARGRCARWAVDGRTLQPSL